MTQRRRAAQASGIIGFFAMLVIAALLWALMNPAIELAISTVSTQATTTTATNAIEERRTIWNSIMIYPVVLAGVFLIARSILQSRRGP